MISQEEVWLRAYTATLSGGYSLTNIDTYYIAIAAVEAADQAVKDFAKRFPAFRFHSEENKE